MAVLFLFLCISSCDRCVGHSKNWPKFMHLTIQKQATACLPYSEKPTFSYLKWSVFHLEYVVGISVDNSKAYVKLKLNPIGCQQKISDIPVLYPFAAHVELIQ